MKVVTARQMQTLEEITFSEYGFSSLVMMENAAQGFCDKLEQETGSVRDKKVGIFCGKGNNGGDGFAIARLLSVRGAQPIIFLGFEPKHLKNDALTNYEAAVRFGIEIRNFSEFADDYDILIDALFGTGFHGEIDGAEAEMVQQMNASSAFVAAVDMPSGANASDGTMAKCCVDADLTVTFGSAKLGQFLYPAKKQVGKLLISEISIPCSLWDNYQSNYFTLDSEIFNYLPKRECNAHKGNFGKCLIFAGSKGMCGAAVMASAAVLKSGAGMATLATSEEVSDIAAAKLTEVMTLALPMRDLEHALYLLEGQVKRQDILLLGCGLGRDESVCSLVQSLLRKSTLPMVIDADGINALQGNINILKQKKAPAVLTPHLMEFSRISGFSMEEISMNRVEVVRSFAEEYAVTLVLKGADTLVACPDGRVYVNTISNSGMATAGSGDVLSGMIAGLAAQGASLSEAACLGVYLHTLAGNVARECYGEYGMTATDILSAVPLALKQASEWSKE